MRERGPRTRVTSRDVGGQTAALQRGQRASLTRQLPAQVADQQRKVNVTLNAAAASTQTSPVIRSPRRPRAAPPGTCPGRRDLCPADVTRPRHTRLVLSTCGSSPAHAARPRHTRLSAAPALPLSGDERPACLHLSRRRQTHLCSASLSAALAFDSKADLCVCQRLPLTEAGTFVTQL